MFSSLYVFSCNVLPVSIKVELSLAKFLRISEDNFKRFIKKIPQDLFRVVEGSDSFIGNLGYADRRQQLIILAIVTFRDFCSNQVLSRQSGLNLA